MVQLHPWSVYVVAGLLPKKKKTRSTLVHLSEIPSVRATGNNPSPYLSPLSLHLYFPSFRFLVQAGFFSLLESAWHYGVGDMLLLLLQEPTLSLSLLYTYTLPAKDLNILSFSLDLLRGVNCGCFTFNKSFASKFASASFLHWFSWDGKRSFIAAMAIIDVNIFCYFETRCYCFSFSFFSQSCGKTSVIKTISTSF